MAQAPSGSNGAGPSSAMPKAIGSLAKKQDDVTRQGSQKMKFVPTLPSRRKKIEDPSQAEAKPTLAAKSADSGRGRGRGRGRGKGDEGRGGPPRAPVELVASGPFALGPAMSGTSARRTQPRSNFAPPVPFGSASSSKLGEGLTRTSAPSLKKEPIEDAPLKSVDDEVEVYSDPDEGVEIVDMEDVKRLDWMAPESISKEKSTSVNKKRSITKKESNPNIKGKTKESNVMDLDFPSDDENVDNLNALDLSESEEEEEMEDIMHDFESHAHATGEKTDTRAEKIYLFQFPLPFPEFTKQTPLESTESTTPPKLPHASKPVDKGKKVTFAPDVKTASASETTNSDTSAEGMHKVTAEDKTIDGAIGQVEIYQSGAVKMRLENGMLFEESSAYQNMVPRTDEKSFKQITAATQPSFLQHAVHVDYDYNRINVLGEINRRFIASPDISTLLAQLEAGSAKNDPSIGEGMISMDTG